MTNQNNAKKLAGEASLEYVKDGMTIGLGSGSTVYWMIRKLGEHIKNGLDVKGIPSSRQTQNWANEFGVPLTDFAKTQTLDIAIDGADEVDQGWHLIKGGGGALVREKIIAAAAREFVVIVDESKTVSRLGDFKLPVEILPFGWEVTAERITGLDGTPVIRRNADGDIFVSDNGNYIVDCDFGMIHEPKTLQQQLKQLTGVVDTGLFVGMADEIIVGYSDRASVLSKK
ncbi:ribose-5-phosphate isomerase RpiA [Lentibacillus sp. CBA3610]|uniref:ribose-5-phosphate isomerase RpiA n=1 Tax=Lentibacillus sp. CBA3610 TaxID=2518176 RepID=UPI00159546F3|nr:ribose-5-phosphate isomerase RpiA [Lentibacillus sp. CBA3610]QKY70015.1 ribose-5-phosphate isomerase RpiA [Lentibacillus sp. CBA3610]